MISSFTEPFSTFNMQELWQPLSVMMPFSNKPTATYHQNKRSFYCGIIVLAILALLEYNPSYRNLEQIPSITCSLD
jgi:hypothetical protein